MLPFLFFLSEKEKGETEKKKAGILRLALCRYRVLCKENLPIIRMEDATVTQLCRISRRCRISRPTGAYHRTSALN